LGIDSRLTKSKNAFFSPHHPNFTEANMANQSHNFKLSMLCAASLTVLTAGAQTSTEIYGQLGASLNTRSGVSTSATTDLGDNQIAVSYLGFRGSEDLGGGLRAMYRLESSVAIDTGIVGATVAGTNRFFNRQSFLGLDFGKAGALTLGRQFHAATDRVIRTLDVYNAAGTLAVTPIGLFGVNRFVGNDSRADNSIKYRVAGPAGLEAGVSYGISEDTVGKSYSMDIAQITSGYEAAAYLVNFSSPTLGRVNTNGDCVHCGGYSGAWRSHPSNSPRLSTACPSSVATSA
jgi:predicted porin